MPIPINECVKSGISLDGQLPRFWRQEAVEAMKNLARVTVIDSSHKHPTTREDELLAQNGQLPLINCGAVGLHDALPWLNAFYRGWLHQKVQETMSPKAIPSDELQFSYGALILGVGMRLDTHIDVYPFGANIYVHEPSAGGNLIVSPNPSDTSYREVVRSVIMSSNSQIVYPEAGTVSTLQVSDYPHTVTTVGQADLHRELDYIQTSWVLPDLRDPMFWELARLSFNFNYEHADLPNAEEGARVMRHAYGI